MADYEFRYRLLQAPEARRDGSGMVAHGIEAQAQPQGASNEWATIPGRHKTVVIPADEMKAMNDMSTGGAKNTAYKQTIASNLNTQPVAVNGWDAVTLEAVMDANDASALEASRANEYLTVTLGLSYPIPFSY